MLITHLEFVDNLINQNLLKNDPQITTCHQNPKISSNSTHFFTYFWNK